MAGDTVRELIDQIDALGDATKVDILVHSSGGDALASWKLMSIMRERLHHVAVLVPFHAFSAATLFALGADEIVMHPHASLGPIDPQITLTQPDGTKRQFSYEDVGAFLRFLANAFFTASVMRVESTGLRVLPYQQPRGKILSARAIHIRAIVRSAIMSGGAWRCR